MVHFSKAAAATFIVCLFLASLAASSEPTTVLLSSQSHYLAAWHTGPLQRISAAGSSGWAPRWLSGRITGAPSSSSRDSQQQQLQRKPPLQGNRPYVIAHRGASGPLPEHTLPAYTTAIAQGADFIECDVVVTRDLQLICRHEPNLNSTTDAWQHFAHRATTYTIDGADVSGIFASDLTLAEIKQLRAKQRWAFRDHAQDGAFEVATLAEFLEVAKSAPRAVGIYPEVKHPTWHNALPQLLAANVTIEQLIVDALHARGYAASAPVNSAAWRAQPVFVQSFEPTSLQRLAGMTRMPLVLLMGGWDGYVAPDTGMTHAQMLGGAFLSELARYVAGVGPWKDSLYTVTSGIDSSGNGIDQEGSSSSTAGSAAGAGAAAAVAADVVAPCHSSHCSSFAHPDSGRRREELDSSSSSSSSSSRVKSGDKTVRIQSNGLVAKLHSYGFQVHPYTLRDEAQFVPGGCSDVSCEFAWLFDCERIDGGFADWPGTLHNWLQQRGPVDA